MIKLELNKIPGYTVDENNHVTIVFANGGTWPTCSTMEKLGFKTETTEGKGFAETLHSFNPEPEVKKVSEETLLSVVAMFTDKAEIPR